MKKIAISYFSLVSITLLLLFMSCNTAQQTNTVNDKVLAKVNNKKLLQSDIENLTPNGISKEDSAVFVKAFINKWVSSEVFYQEALKYLNTDDINFDSEIENYKKELVTHKFQTKLIDEKLDTTFSDSEIEDYYNENSQNFLLKNNIVKVIYVKTPNSIPNLDKLKKAFYSTNPKDAIILNSLSIQYANNYYTNNTWLMYDDLKKEIPQLRELPDYNIQNGKTFEFTDNTSFYFLKIIEVKTKNTISPLNFEKNNIKAMLLNERKQNLINSIQKDFFEKSKTNKEIEIYN